MSKTSSFILGFMMGVGTVVATTKFLTSETGKAIQDRLGEMGDDLKDRVSDYYDYADSTAEDIKESALNKWDEFSDRFKNNDDSEDLDDNNVTDLEFDLDEDGTMHPTGKEDTSEFQQVTSNVEEGAEKAVDHVKDAVDDVKNDHLS
ncbi:YtxH domain-containing protein [Xylocopilactobacillus apis]|uniref:YtxH domain-containing protein n=1 Tax=Xylocopilactobacillus apis TaxID=2932183 RepID=A0AAU9D7C0_9LACO|nr:YtxH domain-containing protein [Xylocopilactobacillus apis]BDR56672.1 hypothetical protein KIMC2_12340 [Xylocopilactobacillus apis]